MPTFSDVVAANSEDAAAASTVRAHKGLVAEALRSRHWSLLVRFACQVIIVSVLTGLHDDMMRQLLAFVCGKDHNGPAFCPCSD